MTTAKLIGESSAGMTAIEIYDNDKLVWSHQYFTNGASHNGYIDGLCQVYDDMLNCADYAQYDGCDGYEDDNGEFVPEDFDVYPETGVMLEFDSSTKKWTIGDDARRLGQSDEIVDACMIAGLIPADDQHDDHLDNDVVIAIASHINKHKNEQ